MTPVEWVDTPLLDHIRKILLSIHMFQASSSYLTNHSAGIILKQWWGIMQMSFRTHLHLTPFYGNMEV